MYVAITGTPGTGKTSAVEVLSKRGYGAVSVKDLAIAHRTFTGPEDEMDVDVEALSNSLEQVDDLTIIDGHLAHWLPVSICIVLRCNPASLSKRLGPRGYAGVKLRENLEAEAVDVVLVESLENCKTVFEIDTTDLSPDRVADAIENVINGKGDEYQPGKVDWSQVVMDWY